MRNQKHALFRLDAGQDAANGIIFKSKRKALETAVDDVRNRYDAERAKDCADALQKRGQYTAPDGVVYIVSTVPGTSGPVVKTVVTGKTSLKNLTTCSVWSEAEKNTIKQLLAPEPELPYPLEDIKVPNGNTERLYRIPEADFERVFRALWPFESEPKMTDIAFDIHEEKLFVINEMRVARVDGYNMLVTPNYTKSGGMLVDVLLKDDDVGVAQAVRPVSMTSSEVTND